MLLRVGQRAEVSADPDVIQRSSKLILPGVGHFRYGMDMLRRSGLLDVLNARVQGDKVPILGICLGAQLMGEGSEEGGSAGLNWMRFRTVAFDRAKVGGHIKVPHMGWAETRTASETPLFSGIERPARFYYVHSYHFACDNDSIEMCYATHGYEFVSGIQSGNMFGVQFHPEKSHRFGLTLLKNFAENL